MYTDLISPHSQYINYCAVHYVELSNHYTIIQLHKSIIYCI